MTLRASAKIDFRKIMKVLPVAAFVLTLGFYYLFSYLQASRNTVETTSKSGFNTELPAPNLDDRYKNKLDIYMEARQDSLRRLKQARKDSLLFPAEHPTNITNADLPDVPAELGRRPRSYDQNERKVEQALERLQAALTQQAAAPSPAGQAATPTIQTQATADLAQLEKLMNTSVTNPSEDAEIKRLDGMLDKILEIQQPGRNSQHVAAPEDTLTPFAVSANEPKLSEAAGDNDTNGFYGISDEVAPQQAEQPPGNGTIAAVVHADQRVRTGSIVRLRLVQDMYVNNARVPANSFVFGKATVSKERVELDIRHAVYANTVLPVRLAVFDIDGISGISAPGTDVRDAGREGLGQAAQNLELYSMDPSIGAQAAASGIQAAKSLFSKKTKTPYALLKADHKVMLVNARF